MNNLDVILSKVYELHRVELERLKANHTLELNTKLGQINKQAETIRELKKLRDEAEHKWDDWHKFTDEGLAKRDSEVRKPLVDALEVAGSYIKENGVKQRIDDALAKVKENPNP